MKTKTNKISILLVSETQSNQLTGYSAHADQQGLVDWVKAMDDRPGEIRLVHGEEGAQRELGKVLGI